MFNSIFVSSFLYYKAIQIRWKLYISVTFSCIFFFFFFFWGGGGGGVRRRGSEPLAQAVVTKLKLCK